MCIRDRFGTAGFGGDPDYFNMLLENVKKLLPSDAVYLGCLLYTSRCV